MWTILKKYFSFVVIILQELNNLISSQRIRIKLQRIQNNSEKMFLYMEPRTISAIISRILNGDTFLCRLHLRLDYNTFITTVQHVPKKHHGWSMELELVCFLYWMACGCSYRVAGGFMGFSRYTKRDIVYKMLDVVIGMKQVINHVSVRDLEILGRKFVKKAGSKAFQNIMINCPVNKHDEYINHKIFYSIQVQAVVDSNSMFTDVFVGFPGSVHDTQVFLNSPLYSEGIYPPNGYYLLGDMGYPCQLKPVAIITPFKEPLSPAQRRFNEAHSAAGITVECAFGALKTRWRNTFNRALELSILNCTKPAFCALVLHNICTMKDDFWDYNFDMPPQELPESNLNEPEGAIII